MAGTAEDDIHVGIVADANTAPGANKAAADIEGAGARMRESLNATASGTRDSMNQMLEHIKTSVTASAGHFNSLTLRVREVSEAFSHLGEVLLAAFAIERIAHMVEGVANMGEAFELAAQKTGMSIQELNALKIAAANVNVSFEEVVSSMSRFGRQLSDAGNGTGRAAAAYRALQIDVRDAEGHLKSFSQILPEIADKFKEMEDGQNKIAIATAIGSRGFANMIPVLNQGSEGLAKAEEQAKRTGVYMSGGFVEAAGHMEGSTKELGFAFKGLGLALIREFTPAIDILIQGLADCIEWLTRNLNAGGALYPVIMTLATAFDGLAVVLSVVKAGLMSVWEVFMAFANGLVIVLATLSNISAALARLDWAGAKKAAADGLTALEAEAKTRFENITKENQKAVDTIKTVWEHLKGGVDQMAPKPEEHKKEAPELPKDVPLVQQFKEQLEQMKDAENSWLDFSKAREVEFWQSKLATLRAGTEDYKAVYHELVTAKKALAKEEYEKEIADMKLSMAAAAKDGEQRVQLAKEIARKTADAYGEGSLQAKAALIELQREENALFQQRRSQAESELEIQEGHANRQIAIDEDSIRTRRAIGDLSAIEEVTALQRLEEQKYNIEKKALEDRLKLAHTEQAERQKLMKQIEALEDKHAINQAKLNNQMLQQTAATYEKYMAPVSRAISGTVQGMIQGTLTLRQGIANLMQSILASIVDMLVQSGMKWAATELAKTAASTAGDAERLASQETVSAASMATSKMTGVSQIMDDAFMAAAGSYASVSAIPFIGWIMAPGVAAEAFATVAGMAGGIASAAGGWEVPMDTFAMVHKDEKILPARVSKGLDQILDNQERGMGSSGRSTKGGDTHVHFNVSAIDAQSFGRALRRQDSTLYQASRSFVRNNFGNRSINPPVR